MKYKYAIQKYLLLTYATKILRISAHIQNDPTAATTLKTVHNKEIIKH